MIKERKHTEDDITDRQIRIVGTSTPFSTDDMEDVLRENEKKAEETQEKVDCSLPAVIVKDEPRRGKGRLIAAIIAVVLMLAAGATYFWRSCNTADPTWDDSCMYYSQTVLPQPGKDSCYVEPIVEVEAEEEGVAEVLVERQDTTVNDIPLRLFTCHGGLVELSTKRPSTHDDDVLLAAQAADVRSDIDAPAGAFVLHGELLSKGHSKLGFCSIIGNQITIGYARETPELESAIEQNGDFFRHYSLVCKGQLIEVPVKGKAIRRALCIRDNQVSIIECRDRESYHDFSQALLDMGCSEALALVGGDALLFYRDNTDNQLIESGTTIGKRKKTENYIVWRK